MAGFVPAPGVVSLDLVCLLDNQKVENTFNYHVTGTIDRTKLAAMATTIFTWATANKTNWPTNWQVLFAYLRDLTSVNSTVYEGTPTTAIVGTKAGIVLPSNVTFALKRETGLAGRANRGRVFWMGLVDGDRSDDNHIDPARANNQRNSLNTLMNSQVTDNSAQEVILHKKLGTYTPVIGYTYADLTLDAMRRRLPDHNRHR